MPENRVISYSQNREDVILAAFFDDDETGFYVDVGASHPVLSSVTKLFSERGWHGINIEPNKKHYNLLVADRPRDINLNIGVSNKPGELVFREYKGYGLSTFSGEMKHEYEAQDDELTQSFKDYKVEVTTLKDIFKTSKVKKISFLKVDIEGFEKEALEGNDWEVYRPEVICIESNHIVHDWRPLLAEKGYEKVFFDGLNDYYVAKEASRRKETFSYPNKILLGKPIIPLQWHIELGQAAGTIRKTQLDLQSEKAKLWDAQRTIAHLEAELINQRRIRNLAKSLIRGLDQAVKNHIEDLNKSKRRKASNGVDLAVDVSEPENTSQQEVLSAIRQNDFDNFFSNSSSGGFKKAYLYKILKTSYAIIRWPIVKLGKLTAKVLKKLRSMR